MLIGVKNADAVHEADNGLGSLLHEAGRCRFARQATVRYPWSAGISVQCSDSKGTEAARNLA
jgi:hypothetical protein